MDNGYSSSRRQLLCTLGVGTASLVAGCAESSGEAALSVPEEALVDERVELTLEGAPENERVTLRAEADSAGARTDWEAVSVFETEDDGRVDVTVQAPLEGTYEGTDPMGLFWSKRPEAVPPGESTPADVWFHPESDEEYTVRVSAEVDGANGTRDENGGGEGDGIAETTTTRLLYDPDIDERHLDGEGENGLVGTLCTPPAGGPAPGVLLLHGAGGEPLTPTGRLLASRGFTTLSLQYFGEPESIPDHLVEIPLEYVDGALEWLGEQEAVSGSEIGVVGLSRGGELALLLASKRSSIEAVVGLVPSGIVWEGLGADQSAPETSAWTVDGEPLAFLEWEAGDLESPPVASRSNFEAGLENADEDDRDAATIPVEEIDAPVLLFSATDDRRWPSRELTEIAVDRLDGSDHEAEYEHEHHVYEGAGHYITPPHVPTTGTDRDERSVFGGDPEANARANADSWDRSLSFLRESLEHEE